MKVFVAGGTGVIGRPIVSALVAAGHDVTATTHRPSGVPVLERRGAHPAVMDGRDPASIRQAIATASPEVVVNQMTSLAQPAANYGEWLQVTNHLRSEGTRVLVEAARRVGSRRVVSQSSSYIIRPTAGTTDESTPTYLDAPDPVGLHIRSTVAGEEQVIGTPGVEGIVLRYGFFYGEGTTLGPGGEWVKAVRAGELPVVGDGGGMYPFIHLDDAVSATLLAVDGGEPGVYNVVSDEPAPQCAWIPYLAELLQAPAPGHMATREATEQLGVQAVYYGTELPRVSNARAKARLGMTLKHPSWREGFRELFAKAHG